MQELSGERETARRTQNERAVMDSEDMICLRWEGNASLRYNGKIQDVAIKHILPEYRNVPVGKMIRVKWGRRSKVWKVVVVGQDTDPKPRKCAAKPRCVTQSINPRGDFAALVSVHEEGK